MFIKVQAYDNDGSSPYNTVVYRINEGAKDKFVIDPNTGVVSTSLGASLDPDLSQPRGDLYRLEVVAIDGGLGSAQQTSSVTVTVRVRDVNNKAPILADPGTVHIKENTQVGFYGFIILKTNMLKKFEIIIKTDELTGLNMNIKK